MLTLHLTILALDFFIFAGVLMILLAMLAMLYSAHLDVPFASTPKDTFDKIFEALDIASGDVVYELGSGDGRFSFAAAKRFPHARFIGIELNPLLYIFSQTKKRYLGLHNIEFRRQSLFDTDLSSATKIYAYLLTPVMLSLYPKLERELKGVRMASRAFQFKTMAPIETIELSKKIGSHGEHLLYVYDFVANK